MTTRLVETVEAIFGVAESSAAASAENTALPEPIATLIAHFGVSTFASGRFAFVDPAIVSQFAKGWWGPGNPVPFARNGLGNIFVWAPGTVRLVDVHYGASEIIADSLETLFEQLAQPDLRKEYLRLKYFIPACEIYGPPERDECFSFKQAIALGGIAKVRNMHKVHFIDELDLWHRLA